MGRPARGCLVTTLARIIIKTTKNMVEHLRGGGEERALNNPWSCLASSWLRRRSLGARGDQLFSLRHQGGMNSTVLKLNNHPLLLTAKLTAKPNSLWLSRTDSAENSHRFILLRGVLWRQWGVGAGFPKPRVGCSSHPGGIHFPPAYAAILCAY